MPLTSPSAWSGSTVVAVGAAATSTATVGSTWRNASVAARGPGEHAFAARDEPAGRRRVLVDARDRREVAEQAEVLGERARDDLARPTVAGGSRSRITRSAHGRRRGAGRTSAVRPAWKKRPEQRARTSRGSRVACACRATPRARAPRSRATSRPRAGCAPRSVADRRAGTSAGSDVERPPARLVGVAQHAGAGRSSACCSVVERRSAPVPVERRRRSRPTPLASSRAHHAGRLGPVLARDDRLDDARREHQAVEQRVRREPVRAVHAAARGLAARPEARAASTRRRGRSRRRRDR